MSFIPHSEIQIPQLMIQHLPPLSVFALSGTEMISSQSLSSLDQGITGAAATRGVFPQDAAFHKILNIPQSRVL
jgi:hypothetical protein